MKEPSIKHKKIKQKDGSKMMYFGIYIIIYKLFFPWEALNGRHPSTEICA